MSDIFVDMQAKVGCRYISDLPCMKRAVWFELRRMPLSDYGMEELMKNNVNVIEMAAIQKDVMEGKMDPSYY